MTGEDGVRLTPSLLCSAYRAGIFPMARARSEQEVLWMDPDERCILPLENFRLSRRDVRSLRRANFGVGLDGNFRGVVGACASRQETWINREIEEAYGKLHDMGLAHSVEVYADAAGVAGGAAEGVAGDANSALVGGLYGVGLGGVFFGESMFSRASHASKAALRFLVERLKACGYVLLDVQFWTAHLERLGAVEVSREEYHRLLAEGLRRENCVLTREK